MRRNSTNSDLINELSNFEQEPKHSPIEVSIIFKRLILFLPEVGNEKHVTDSKSTTA
jgi:hypothetical protein